VRVPVVALMLDEAERAKLFAQGVDDVLPLPAAREQLGRLLRRWLPGGSRSLQLVTGEVAHDATTIRGDSLLHALIDEAAYAQLMLPLQRNEPDLLNELLNHLEQDGHDLIDAVESGSRAAIALAAQRLASSAAGLTAAKLAEVSRRIEAAAGEGDEDGCQLYCPMVEPLLEASLIELRQRVSV
jgi:HPt (histidine-containing phosphotransfer) domain-containing protein